jgi:hypothetical protein
MGMPIGYHCYSVWDWLAGVALSTRLAIFDWLFPMPETPVDRAIRKEGERLRKAFPGLLPAVLCGLLLSPDLSAAAEHRSRAVAREFQREHPCPSTGQTTGACPFYTRDHIVPLACGGADAVLNMQWQTDEDAKAKDKWELDCRRYAR